MNLDFAIIAAYPIPAFYDGEGDAAAAEAAAAAAAAAAAEGGGAGDGKKSFTQDEVNAIIAKEKGTWRKQTEEQVKQLEQLRKSKGLSEKEKGDLQKRIDDLNGTLLTKEELAKKDRATLEKQHKEEKEKLESERNDWQGRYTRERIDRDIIAAAKGADALDEEQFVDLLAPKARLEQVLDEDGQPTGEWAPKVKLKSKDKDGKSVTLDLTVPEAIKHMKESEGYGNLFKSGAKGGLGGTGGRGDKGRGSGKNPAEMTPAEYREFRVKSGLKQKSRSG